MEQINPLPNLPMSSEIPTNPPVSSPPSNKSLLIILLVIFVVILFSLVGYFLIKSQTPSPTPVSSHALLTQATPTPDPTANWKTYTSSNLGYSFKYPTYWKIFDEKTEGTTIYLQKIDDKTFPNPSLHFVMVWLDSRDITTATRLLNYVDAGNENQSKISTITLQDRNVIQAEVSIYEYNYQTAKKDLISTEYRIFIPIGKKTLTIFAPLNQKETLDQILSTFKFLN